MSSNQPTQPKRFEVRLTVSTEDQARELDAAWQEILAGKRTRLNTAAEDLNEIIERAMTGLQRIVQAIEQNAGTGQTGRLVRFLAGVYNGGEYPFDLTDLRALDTELANACIDYLNYDRLAKAEVHTHLPKGGRQMQWLLAQAGIRPQLHLSSDEAHESRLYALAERLKREPGALLKQALGDLLAEYEDKTFGSLQAAESSPDADRPLIHARALSESVAKPLCGASDGPWSARGFDFARLSCHECQFLVLNPQAAPT